MDPILLLIVGCEVGFWILVILGLAARYLMGRRRLGATLLAMTPVVDVILLVAVTLHLQRGGSASTFHGFAAIYVGVSLVYGHKIISWADARFAHRFAGGPAPEKLYGWAHTRESWRDVLRTLLAVVIAGGIVGLLVLWVDDLGRTRALLGILPALAIWFAVDLISAISSTFAPRNKPDVRQAEAEDRAQPSRRG